MIPNLKAGKYNTVLHDCHQTPTHARSRVIPFIRSQEDHRPVRVKDSTLISKPRYREYEVSKYNLWIFYEIYPSASRAKPKKAPSLSRNLRQRMPRQRDQLLNESPCQIKWR